MCMNFTHIYAPDNFQKHLCQNIDTFIYAVSKHIYIDTFICDQKIALTNTIIDNAAMTMTSTFINFIYFMGWSSTNN